MAKTVIVKLTDDLDGSEAEETVAFSVDGKAYEIDLSAANAAAFRKDLDKYLSKARPVGRRAAAATAGQPKSASAERAPTLFSQLDVEEKDRFRAWAKMPNARRIADARVKEWIDAGKP